MQNSSRTFTSSTWTSKNNMVVESKIIVHDGNINDISSTSNCISASSQTKDERLMRSISS